MYYIVYGILYVFSLLPFFILYRIADFAYFLVYYVFGYRKKVVFSNLLIAFPEKTEKERRRIAKDFYHNLIDTFIESLKFISISKKQILKRSTGEFDLVNEYIAKGYSINLMAGHQFNWEYGNALYSMKLTVPYVGIYMPITNKSLDRIFYNFRSKFGATLISATDFKNKMHGVFSGQHTIGLAADQNPGNPSNAYWMNFLGKPAPFVTGPSKGAVKNNSAVILFGFTKVKRGYYHFSAIKIAERAASYTPQELTLLYKNELEKVIRKDPANYLWSHRRWKYDWKPEYGEIIS